VTSRWKWVSIPEVARELDLGGQAAKADVCRAADKGWLETEDERSSCFRLSIDLMKRLDEVGLPLA
jgi:hypothetical protein